MEFERPGKAIPRLVMRPFMQGSIYDTVYWFDNRHYVIAAPSLLLLVTVAFGLLAFPGIPLFFTWVGLHEVVFLYWAAFFLFIGGGGCMLTWNTGSIFRFVLFDREKGAYIKGDYKRRKSVKPKPPQIYPFHEIEARLASVHSSMGALHQFDIHLFHDTVKTGGLFGCTFGNRAQALGFWAFLLQYMDKEAPLPDVSGLWPYPNRTSGVGSPEQWKAFEKKPGFIDPLDVHQGHWQFDPPEDARKIYDLYEPRNMAADIAPVNGPHDPCRQIETQAKTTPLPQKVLRPFFTAAETNVNDKAFVMKGSNFHDRFHYLAAWTLLCAGLALFGFSGLAAWPVLAAAPAYFIYFRRQRRSKGIVFNRETGQVILHHGLRLNRLVLDFDRCEGRLVRTDHREGFSSYRLQLHHPGRRSIDLGACGCVSLEYLLGFWSFLVRYMDKNAPLPDVKGLEDYPGKDEGLGPWKTWAEKTIRKDHVDPFAQWLKELEDKGKPELTKDLKPGVRGRSTVQTSATPTGQTSWLAKRH